MKKVKRKSSKPPTQAGLRRFSRRRALFFVCLIALMTGTSVLLKAMAPVPMRPDAADTLFAPGSADSLDRIFQMDEAVRSDRWRYLYIHHSKTGNGNALTLGHGMEGIGDHFVIGNGDGLADGELQISQRWNHQLPAISPSTGVKVDADCISVCIVGDFDLNPPTPMQLGRLGQLVQTLQARCAIPSNHVLWMTQNGSIDHSTAAGIGRYFPAAAFHDQLRNTFAALP